MNTDDEDAAFELPATVAEAVERLRAEIDATILEQIRRTPKERLRVYHHEWGPMVQHRFRLDGRNDALLEDCRRLYVTRMRRRFSEFELERRSTTETLMPRGSAFVVILEALWLRLNEIAAAERTKRRR